MKELHEFMKYIDYCVYDIEDETVHLLNFPDIANFYTDYEYIYEHIIGPNDCSWEFDIALDCVKNMSEKDKENILSNLDPHEYLWGYAAYIRSHYNLWKPKKHFVLDADGISMTVMKLVFSILSPEYDFRAPREMIDDWEENEGLC